MAPEAVILSGCRTAIGTFGGVFKDVSAVELGTVAVREAVRRAGVRPDQVDEVVLGCILQAGLGMNPARQVAIKAGLPDSVPATTVNKVCGSGLESVMRAAQAIKAGDAEIVVAGGTENMSRAPYLLPDARWGQRLGDGKALDHMIHEGLTDAFHDIHMGVTAENLVERYGISREDQDAFAAESQRRAESAMKSGAFAEEIVPVVAAGKKGETRIDTDEHPRPGTTAESLAKLKPAFKKDGTVTAGNASGINDGAAALVVAGAERARRLGLTPMARIVSYASAAVDPRVMGIGPVPAVRKALEKAVAARRTRSTCSSSTRPSPPRASPCCASSSSTRARSTSSAAPSPSVIPSAPAAPASSSPSSTPSAPADSATGWPGCASVAGRASPWSSSACKRLQQFGRRVPRFWQISCFSGRWKCVGTPSPTTRRHPRRPKWMTPTPNR